MIHLTKVGRTGSTLGKDGDIKLFADDGTEEIIVKSTFLFFYLQGSKVPFKIEKLRDDLDPMVFHLEDITNKELAQQFVNKEVFVESDEVIKLDPASELAFIGFHIHCENDKWVGEVIDVEQHPEQILLLIKDVDASYRIPLHEDLIEDMDIENKRIVYSYDEDDIKLFKQ